MSLGKNIADARRKRNMTQEALAEKLGVSFQAVSSWERDETLPETYRLKTIAAELRISLDTMFADDMPDWTLRNPNFDAGRMYTYLKAKAQTLHLPQTLAALPFMREKHAGQWRKGTTEMTPYIAHPMTLACHALAAGMKDDDVIAACLLHDVIEDTDTQPADLPVNERVRRAVCLVSYNTYPGAKEAIKPLYYKNIAQDPLACLIKCLDRCNNLSCMADGFSREKMIKYVRETEAYILPFLDIIKAVPEWNDAAWLLRYQMTTLLETYKRML